MTKIHFSEEKLEKLKENNDVITKEHTKEAGMRGFQA